jgi:hypothetical protein
MDQKPTLPAMPSGLCRQIRRVVHAYLKSAAQLLVLLGECGSAMLGEPLAPDRLTRLIERRKSAFLDRPDMHQMEPVGGL